MNALSHPHEFAILAVASAYVAAGLGLGMLYFGALWWSARLFSDTGRLRTVLAVAAARFAMLGGALALASHEGASPLLEMALGILVARSVVMRRAREALP